LRLARCAWFLGVLVGLAPVAQAEDAKPVAPKPAVTGPAATKPVAPATSKPAPATTPADDEFLEFLGSLDDDNADADWLDYLSHTDIEKVAKAKKK
jgi:hypothetical protein